MVDIILDTVIDSLKLLPFLFIAFLIMEVLEHKLNNKSKEKIEKSGKFGPIIGAILGAFPQCGFSVMATNLYATRIVSIGTLISIYLATSDEMLPIMLSENIDIKLIISILLIKIVIGMIAGILIDLFIEKKEQEHIKDFCHDEHCDCEHGVLKSTIKHTLNILIFILIIEFILNIAVEYVGKDFLEQLLLKNTVFGSFITSLIGLIPNCGASVIITELFLNKAITFGALIGGLLTGSGVAFVVLFKTNKNLKENIKILFMTYLIGSLVGIIVDILSII